MLSRQTHRKGTQTNREGGRKRKTDRSNETKRERERKQIKTFLDMEKLVGPFHNSEKTEK